MKRQDSLDSLSKAPRCCMHTPGVHAGLLCFCMVSKPTLALQQAPEPTGVKGEHANGPALYCLLANRYMDMFSHLWS